MALLFQSDGDKMMFAVPPTRQSVDWNPSSNGNIRDFCFSSPLARFVFVVESLNSCFPLLALLHNIKPFWIKKAFKLNKSLHGWNYSVVPTAFNRF